MDPIYPWLDPVEVRRLADRLMKPNREPSVTVADAGFDEGFVGFASGAAGAVVEAPPPPLPPQPAREVPATSGCNSGRRAGPGGKLLHRPRVRFWTGSPGFATGCTTISRRRVSSFSIAKGR